MSERTDVKPAKPKRGGRRCPLCRAAAAPAWQPFCSQRCAEADLVRWLRGGYRIPGRDGEAAIGAVADDAGGEDPES